MNIGVLLGGLSGEDFQNQLDLMMTLWKTLSRHTRNVRIIFTGLDQLAGPEAAYVGSRLASQSGLFFDAQTTSEQFGRAVIHLGQRQGAKGPDGTLYVDSEKATRYYSLDWAGLWYTILLTARGLQERFKADLGRFELVAPQDRFAAVQALQADEPLKKLFEAMGIEFVAPDYLDHTTNTSVVRRYIMILSKLLDERLIKLATFRRQVEQMA